MAERLELSQRQAERVVASLQGEKHHQARRCQQIRILGSFRLKKMSMKEWKIIRLGDVVKRT
jgi:hypothetical protein